LVRPLRDWDVDEARKLSTGKQHAPSVGRAWPGSARARATRGCRAGRSRPRPTAPGATGPPGPGWSGPERIGTSACLRLGDRGHGHRSALADVRIRPSAVGSIGLSAPHRLRGPHGVGRRPGDGA
jgi:hypothetical protein